MTQKEVKFVFIIKSIILRIKIDGICSLDNCLVTEIRSQGEKCF